MIPEKGGGVCFLAVLVGATTQYFRRCREVTTVVWWGVVSRVDYPNRAVTALMHELWSSKQVESVQSVHCNSTVSTVPPRTR